MKTTNNKLANKLARTAILIFCTLAIMSCDKDNSQNGEEIPSGQNQLIINVAGVSDQESNNLLVTGSSPVGSTR